MGTILPMLMRQDNKGATMNRWIVKAGSWESKPLTMEEAAKVAEAIVDASDTFANVRIDFHVTTYDEPKTDFVYGILIASQPEFFAVTGDKRAAMECVKGMDDATVYSMPLDEFSSGWWDTKGFAMYGEPIDLSS